MPRPSQAWLQDILEAIAEIRRFTAGFEPSLQTMPLLNYNAVLYSLLKVTEAVRNLPDELKQKRPDLPWADMVRTGNRLRHKYFRIDRMIIADIVHYDLPELERAVQTLWQDLGLGNLPEFD